MALNLRSKRNQITLHKLHIGPIRNVQHSRYIMSVGAADELISLHIMKEFFCIET